MTFLSAMSTKVKMEAILLYVGYYISQFTRCIVMTSLDDRLDTESERFWYHTSVWSVIKDWQEDSIRRPYTCTYRQSMYQLHCQSILVEWFHLSLKRDLYPDQRANRSISWAISQLRKMTKELRKEEWGTFYQSNKSQPIILLLIN